MSPFHTKHLYIPLTVIILLYPHTITSSDLDPPNNVISSFQTLLSRTHELREQARLDEQSHSTFDSAEATDQQQQQDEGGGGGAPLPVLPGSVGTKIWPKKHSMGSHAAHPGERAYKKKQVPFPLFHFFFCLHRNVLLPYGINGHAPFLM